MSDKKSQLEDIVEEKDGSIDKVDNESDSPEPLDIKSSSEISSSEEASSNQNKQ